MIYSIYRILSNIISALRTSDFAGGALLFAKSKFLGIG
nr:MAG TPA: hypothetical protein [Caudoviricetes sp.]